MGEVVLFLGGARSGKSTAAEKMALMNEKVAYIATAENRDEEMQERINKHRARRPASWLTVEEPVEVAKVIYDVGHNYDVILLDCLTLLISNWLALPGIASLPPDEQVDTILGQIETIMVEVKKVKAKLFIVSNEVGMSIVPLNPLARLYRDIVGLANQKIAAHAEKVLFTVAGLTIDLKKV